MSLTPGTRIGSYEILNPLGAGGMGEVYLARDVRLERNVAVKALPQAFLADPERLARFEREAKLLASLNHPNIAAIYGLEEADGVPHLILEYVDGGTLGERLGRGALSARDVLEVGGQIAAAIEAAHDQGIVHRDLKPGNVMLTASGKVKVLDFGLAKGTAPTTATAVDLSASPTLAVSATAAGMILGTAPYMSPEQARGQEIDRRSDIWAFGCLLYECLVGRGAFAGATVSDVIARILEREPDWNALPTATPVRLRDLVRRCLTKEAADRPRDIGDLRRELAAIGLDMSSSSGIRAASSDVPSLAVLYFENLSSDQESEYFCAGITEDILTDLSKIKGLKVASRNAVSRYRGQSVDIPRVASELGVRAVLEGSVRKAGDRVRISAQLINAADGFHLWADRFDRKLEDVFQVQEEIASAIAEALRVALTPAEAEALVQDRPDDARAYDLYLKGRARYGSYTPASLKEAVDLFQQAIALEPDYALAWAGLADSYAQLSGWDRTGDTAEYLRLGLAAGRKAVELNPGLAEAHKALALVLNYSGDQEGARAGVIRALEINPRFLPAITNLANDDFGLGNLAGAERLLRRGIEIDPQEKFALAWLAFILSRTGRNDEALEMMNRLRRLSDDSFYVTIVHSTRIQRLILKGDLEAAEAAIEKGEADGAQSGSLTAARARLAMARKQEAIARKYFDGVGDESPLNLHSVIDAATVGVWLGEHERAIRIVTRRPIQETAPMLVRLVPELHPLADREPFAPRKCSISLIWPLEGPMMSPSVHAMFREVRVESGRSDGSDVGL